MFTSRDVLSFEIDNMTINMYEFRLQRIDVVKPVHYHSERTFEIHYIKEGSGKLILDDEVYDISPGSIFITGPYVKHGQIPDPGSNFVKYSIYLEIENKKNIDICSKWIAQDKNDILDLLEKVLKEYQDKKKNYNEAIKEYLKLILISINRNFNEGTISTEQTTKDLNNKLFEIEKIFLEEFNSITLSELASRLFIGERQLQRFLQKNYKKTFNELKLEARMLYAANKLEFDNVSIAELSKETGYSTAEHFSYAFRKYFNTSPQRYKKEHLFIENARKNKSKKNPEI